MFWYAALVPIEPVIAPPVLTVEDDLTCRGCGYNLRGLSLIGRCPECSTEVARSVHGDRLRFADPEWVKRMVRGLRLMHISIIVMFAFFMFAVINTLLAILAAGVAEWLWIGFGWVGLAGAALVLFGYPLGWWWAATPDPRDSSRAAFERSALRMTALLFLPAAASLQYSIFPAAPTGIVMTVMMHLCLVVVAVHCWLIVRFFLAIINRCEGVSEEQHRKDQALLGKLLSYSMGLPVLALLLYWVPQVLMSFWAAGGLGAATIGFPIAFAASWLLLLWISIVGVSGRIIRAVKHEQAAGLPDAVTA